MNMTKYAHLLGYAVNRTGSGVYHRAKGDIPHIVPAQDVFQEDSEGKLTIKNPSKPYRNPYFG